MKKTLYILMAFVTMAFQNAAAQNYDVVYSLKMNPDKVVAMVAKESGMPEAVLSFLKDDIRNAKLMVQLKMTKDKSDMKFLKEQSSFVISVMGLKMDAAEMFDNAGINNYCDFAKGVYYIKANIDGQDYIVKTKGEPALKFTAANLYKKIMGHECRKMVDAKNNVTVWYAEDIPFETKMFPGVPGLVLEMTKDSDGFTFTADSVKPTSSGVALPRNAKEITKEQADKMLENIH